MLTETEARELLRRAAATIDVAPPVLIAPPARRRWLVPAVAAAAVLAAVVGGVLVVDDGTTPVPTVPAVTPTPTPTPVDPAAVELAEQLLLFAAGGRDGFPGRDDVRFYVEGTFWNVLTGEQADRSSSYSLCSGVAPPQCGASYLMGVRPRGGHTVTSRLPSCYDRDRVIGRGRGGGARTAYVVSEADGGCAWAVQLRYDGPTGLVAVNTLSTTPDPERDLRDLADRFIAFARGASDSLPVDTPVKLFLNDTLFRTVTPTQAEVRDTYALCDLPASACASHAVELIRSVAEVPALRRDSRVPACLDAVPPALTAEETGGTTSVVITNVDDPCAWAVQLWFNDVDQLVAVDLRTHKQS